MASRLVHGRASASPGNVGDRRDAADGDYHGLACLIPLAIDADTPLAVQAPVTADQRDVALVQPGDLGSVVEPTDHLVAAREHGGDVQRAGDRLSGPGYAVGLGEGLRRAKQRLRRHTGVERALAADERRLDDRHPAACLGQISGGDLAGRTGADDDHVEGVDARCRQRVSQLVVVLGADAPIDSPDGSASGSGGLNRSSATIVTRRRRRAMQRGQ